MKVKEKACLQSNLVCWNIFVQLFLLCNALRIAIWKRAFLLLFKLRFLDISIAISLLPEMSVTISASDKQTRTGHMRYVSIQRQEGKARPQGGVTHTSQGQKEVRRKSDWAVGKYLGGGGKSVKLLFPWFPQVWLVQRALCTRGPVPHSLGYKDPTQARNPTGKPSEWPRTTNYGPKPIWLHGAENFLKNAPLPNGPTVPITKCKILYTYVWRFFLN